MSQADDLGAYREWLDEHTNPDELLFHFPRNKLARVTYRYRGHLIQKIYARELAPATAKRRMGVVISFYRWLIEENLFEPDFPPWQERQYLLSVKNTHGFSMTRSVASTDISIKASKTDDPFEGTIQDGSKLRPLSVEEQQWVMEGARTLGNPEMQLLILFMLLTGARIQTACTLRVRHFIGTNPHFGRALSSDIQIFKLPVGPATGIDTKNDKNMVLQVPRALYEVLRTYAQSSRAKRRRELTIDGDNPDQYLFLTQQGRPYFTGKDEALTFDPKLKRRHQKTGGTVRQYIKDHLIPYIRHRYDKNFHFRIHDLRASFGMNQTDMQMSLVEKGDITLAKARIAVMALMGHASSATTDLYLDYRKQMQQAYAAINGYGDQVQAWISDAIAGIGYNDE
ncbi:tyrosine-type recombinase/integrase [Azospira inquinata]|uniref:Site-specific integrase n=1 Tax=Azospira inquinata TaxID=2785627 RepID=A0A975SPR7_9RHOO|nr:site-specific integrase [Azospira inquinata]QWT47067.1 site-specific integrase [Azospira inquinata]QWT50304.1 site-specific integrase [Azospira inquinata]